MTAPAISKRYLSKNIITAVPAGASESGSLQLPAGHYYIYFFGTQAAATTDPTLEIEAYVDAAQSDSAHLAIGLAESAAFVAGALDLELANTALYGIVGGYKGTVGVHVPVFLPYGLKWTYTKTGGTAIDLTIVAVRLDRD